MFLEKFISEITVQRYLLVRGHFEGFLLQNTDIFQRNSL